MISKFILLKDVKGIDFSANPLIGSRLSGLNIVTAREGDAESFKEGGASDLIPVYGVCGLGVASVTAEYLSRAVDECHPVLAECPLLVRPTFRGERPVAPATAPRLASVFLIVVCEVSE